MGIIGLNRKSGHSSFSEFDDARNASGIDRQPAHPALRITGRDKPRILEKPPAGHRLVAEQYRPCRVATPATCMSCSAR
jgi:hypothetical protein